MIYNILILLNGFWWIGEAEIAHSRPERAGAGALSLLSSDADRGGVARDEHGHQSAVARHLPAAQRRRHRTALQLPLQQGDRALALARRSLAHSQVFTFSFFFFFFSFLFSKLNHIYVIL